jgi:hypothetical protein
MCRLKVLLWNVGDDWVWFIIFIEIGICTGREILNSAAEGAATAKDTINRRPPRREEGPACA